MTLLEHLLDDGYKPADYIDILDSVEQAEKSIEDFKIHPDIYDAEEIEFAENDIEDWNEELSEMRHGWWNLQTEEQMKLENDMIRQWVDEHSDTNN
jgi:hypothetical protein